MIRTLPLVAIMASATATILILNNGGQLTTAFVLPLPTKISASTSSVIKSCFHRSSLVSRSHIISRRMPLHSMVEENVVKNTLDTPKFNQDRNGIYDLLTEDDHLALLAAHPGKIIVMKFYAPWCRTCKGLEPKFAQIAKDPKYAGLPLLFAQMSVQHSKEYIKSLNILALPSVHINAGTEGLIENFPCGPRKIPILKKKIAQVVNSRVDPKTLKLKMPQNIIT